MFFLPHNNYNNQINSSFSLDRPIVIQGGLHISEVKDIVAVRLLVKEIRNILQQPLYWVTGGCTTATNVTLIC